MDIIKKTFNMMLKRPLTIILFGSIFLVYALVSYYNPIISLLLHFSINGDGSILGTIISSLRLAFNFIFNPKIMPVEFLCLAGALALISSLLGFLLSGYFNIVNNEIEGGTKPSRDFMESVRKYFLKVTAANFAVLSLGILFVIFMTVAAVPSLVITKTWIDGKSGIGVTAVFVSIITLAVIFFGSIFFRTILLFWYPAIYNYEKKAFTMGKRIAEYGFWKITLAYLIFDIIFIITESLFIFLSYILIYEGSGMMFLSILVFVIKWAFNTLFFANFVTYNFSVFHMQKATHPDALTI